jgi:hypothetical protein
MGETRGRRVFLQGSSVFFTLAKQTATQEEGEHFREEGEQLKHVHFFFFNLTARAARQKEGEQSREEGEQLFYTCADNIRKECRQRPLRPFF